MLPSAEPTVRDYPAPVTEKTGLPAPSAPRKRPYRAMFLQAVRFGLVSAVALGIDLLVLMWLATLLPLAQLNVSAAVAGGYVVGAFFHFFAARRFVFTPTRHHISLEFVFVFIIGLVGLGLTEGIVLWLHLWFEFAILYAKAVAIAIVFCWNFAARRYLIYNQQEERR